MTEFQQGHQRVDTQVNTVIVNSPPLSIDERAQAYYRMRMIESVQSIQIEDMLKPSLEGVAFIAPNLQKQYGVTTNPWQPVLQEYERTQVKQLTDEQIGQIYDRANGELVILGEPGVGKTTLLQKLTEELLERARQDDSHPIPVIFLLASWANMRQPLEQWLIAELQITYEVRSIQAISWVKADQILPLLDGLDEVATPYREECVAAINAFRAVHGLLPTVVCSRQTDYLALSTRLQIRTAILVQPLTDEQVARYIAGGGEALERLQRALEEDATLQTLAHTPLMLNILSTVYLEKSAGVITDSTSSISIQKQIFTAYIQRMLVRHKKSRRYTPAQTIMGLAWLAGQMKGHNRVDFYIERLQPDYLDGRGKRFYALFAIWLPGALVGMITSLAISAVVISRSSFYFVGIILVGGLLGALLCKSNVSPYHLVRRLLVGLPLSLSIGLIAGVNTLLNSGQPNKLLDGFIEGICWGCCSIILLLYPLKIKTINAQSEGASSRRGSTLRSFLRKPAIYNGLSVWLLVGLIYGGLLGCTYGWVIGVSDGVRYGLIMGLIASLLSLLLSEKGTDIQPVDRVNWSWKSLGASLFAKKHIKAVLAVTAFTGVIIGLSYGLLSMEPNGVKNHLFYALMVCLSIGPLLGLTYWLLVGLYRGVRSESLEDWRRIVPNQGIYHSMHNSLLVGFASFVVIGVFGILCNELVTWVLIMIFVKGANLYLLVDALQVGIILGLSTGLIAGLLNGGLVSLRHYILRFLLYKGGQIPWNYAQFLDEAVHLTFLRRAGGRYLFLHHLLLDYFADPEVKQVLVVPEEGRSLEEELGAF